MTNISAIIGREVLDSRGNPTVEAEVQLATVLSDARSFPAAHRPASTKPSNCAMATKRVFSAKACSKRWKT